MRFYCKVKYIYCFSYFLGVRTAIWCTRLGYDQSCEEKRTYRLIDGATAWTPRSRGRSFWHVLIVYIVSGGLAMPSCLKSRKFVSLKEQLIDSPVCLDFFGLGASSIRFLPRIFFDFLGDPLSASTIPSVSWVPAGPDSANLIPEGLDGDAVANRTDLRGVGAGGVTS
jgi:hypothetical protein